MTDFFDLTGRLVALTCIMIVCLPPLYCLTMQAAIASAMLPGAWGRVSFWLWLPVVVVAGIPTLLATVALLKIGMYIEQELSDVEHSITAYFRHQDQRQSPQASPRPTTDY